MINGIQNIISNPTFFNMTQGTATQMGIKTSLNAVARPGFILLDKNIILNFNFNLVYSAIINKL